MNDNQTRMALMTQRLNKALSPTHLEITDESHHHIGHAGAKDGRGHFAIVIAAKRLNDKTRIEQHRLIYQALSTLMQTDIHALRIQVLQSDGF